MRAASIAWAAADELPKARARTVAGQGRLTEPQVEPAAPPRQDALTKADVDPSQAYRQALSRKADPAQDDDRLRAKVRERLAARRGEAGKEDKPEPPGQDAQSQADADPARAYWQGLSKKPDPSRDEDRLRAKVRERLAARRGGGAKEEKPEPAVPEGLPAAQLELRREMQALDRPALIEAARDDYVQVRPHYTRPMTVQDAARLVSPDYVEAADRAEARRKTDAEMVKAIEHNKGVHRAAEAQAARRWEEMGFFRRAVHRSGGHPDPAIVASENSSAQAIEQVKRLEFRLAEGAWIKELFERVEAAAFRRAEPAATAELARRQERAGVAREVLKEQQRQEVAREQKLTLKRSRGRSLGR